MSKEKEDRDVIFVGPPDGSGGRAALRCRRGRPVDVGFVHKLQHGRPIMGEPVRLHPREAEDWYDVEYLVQEPEQSKGPAKVNSQAFRDNWDKIFCQSLN